MINERKSLLVLVTIGALLIGSHLFVGTPAFSQNIDHWFRILEKHNFAPVAQTGQTVSRAPGDDGALQKGIPWPTPRFTDNGDGTVIDNLTGLIWLKNANCFGQKMWADALTESSDLGGGICGLTDGSIPGDWRLPNVRELQSLIHYGVHDPALPDTSGTGMWSEGNPFTGVVNDRYWSSTTVEGSGDAYYIYLGGGFVEETSKTHNGYYVWPVRSGN